MDYTRALAVLGGAVGIVATVRFLRFVYLYTRPSSLSRYLRSEGKPAWALVTGATDGIGLAFVHELASQGFNVVLHGRNPAKLEQTKQTLRDTHKEREFAVVVADASQSHGMDANIEAIAARVEDLGEPLTVLVNNCGGVLPQPFFGFSETTAPLVDAVLNINARFTTQLTRALLPALTRSQPSLIMNISSVAGSIGLPFQATYSGSKAYLNAWTTSLQREFLAEGKDIEALSLIVGEVTGVALVKKTPDLFIPDTKTFVKAAMGRVGCGRPVVVGYWPHALQLFGVHVLPEPIASWTTVNILKGRIQAEEKKAQ